MFIKTVKVIVPNGFTLLPTVPFTFTTTVTGAGGRWGRRCQRGGTSSPRLHKHHDQQDARITNPPSQRATFPDSASRLSVAPIVCSVSISVRRIWNFEVWYDVCAIRYFQGFRNSNSPASVAGRLGQDVKTLFDPTLIPTSSCLFWCYYPRKRTVGQQIVSGVLGNNMQVWSADESL